MNRRTLASQRFQIIDQYAESGDNLHAFSSLPKWTSGELNPMDYIITFSVANGGVGSAASGSVMLASDDDGYMSVAVTGRRIGSAVGADTVGRGVAGADNSTGCFSVVVRGIRDESKVTFQAGYYFNSTIQYATKFSSVSPTAMLIVDRTQRGGSNTGIGAINLNPSLRLVTPCYVTNARVQVAQYENPGGTIEALLDRSNGAGGTTADSQPFIFSIQ